MLSRVYLIYRLSERIHSRGLDHGNRVTWPELALGVGLPLPGTLRNYSTLPILHLDVPEDRLAITGRVTPLKYDLACAPPVRILAVSDLGTDVVWRTSGQSLIKRRATAPWTISRATHLPRLSLSLSWTKVFLRIGTSGNGWTASRQCRAKGIGTSRSLKSGKHI